MIPSKFMHIGACRTVLIIISPQIIIAKSTSITPIRKQGINYISAISSDYQTTRD